MGTIRFTAKDSQGNVTTLSYPIAVPTVHTAPATIPNDGSGNASAALTSWIANTGQPGDIFKLRREGQWIATYRIPQGIKIGKACTLDLNGCWLETGLTLGADDSNFEANRTLYPALWDDWGEQSQANDEYINPITGISNGKNWPKQRVVVLVAASNVNVTSSQSGARIIGAARSVHYRSPSILGRSAPTGCMFIGPLEGQHGIRVGGAPGTWSNTNHYQNIDIDLTNIAVEFVHGDGIYLGDNHSGIRVHGRTQPESVIGGTVIDTSTIVGYDGQGGNITQGAALTGDRWAPWMTSLPGIHHTGRQGIATDFRNYGTVIEDVSIWRTGRGAVDMEPASCDALIDGMRIRRISTGIITLRTFPCGGARKISNLVIEDTVHYELPTIDTRQPSATQVHEDWRLERIRTGNGVRGKVGIPVWNIDRVRGLSIRDCYIPVKPGGIGVKLNGTVYKTGTSPCAGQAYLTMPASEQVTFSPGESAQFPAVA